MCLEFSLFARPAMSGQTLPRQTHKSTFSRCSDATDRFTQQRPCAFRLNTSNPAKLADFQKLCAPRGIVISGTTNIDLKEIDASPVEVVTHKASQLADDRVLVEDTSLHVEGAELGVNVRWLAHEIGNLVGREALLLTLIAYRLGSVVHIFEGRVPGRLVAPRGPAIPGFVINRHFLPSGQPWTLAEQSDDAINPRALALDALSLARPLCVRPCIHDWQHGWQASDDGAVS